MNLDFFAANVQPINVLRESFGEPLGIDPVFRRQTRLSLEVRNGQRQAHFHPAQLDMQTAKYRTGLPVYGQSGPVL